MAIYAIVHDLLTGFPDAVSGNCWFYRPGTTTPIAIFGDDEGTATTNPAALDSSGAATVYLDQLARAIVQDANGATVFDGVINQDSDTTTANTSAAFTGDTQEDVNDAALVAFGGVDYRYVPSGAWSGMTPKAWMNGVCANVMAYGVTGATQVNDGVTPADSALAAAIADVQARGGADVFLPSGTYLLNSPCAINTTGVTIRGAGSGSTTIVINSGANNGFTVTSANGTRFRGLRITATASTTGKSISVVTTTGLILDDVKTDGAAIGLNLQSVTNTYVGGNSSIAGNTSGIAGSTAIGVTVVGGFLTGGTNGILCSQFSNVTLLGIQAGAMSFDSSSGNIVVEGCSGTIAFTGGAQPASFYQYGNALDGQTINVATGATATAADLLNGSDITFNANSGGAGTVTVPAIVNPPPSTRRGYVITVRFLNAAGGAVTWALNAQFVLVGAAAPANTAAHTILFQFLWDGATSKFRELSRADTIT